MLKWSSSSASTSSRSSRSSKSYFSDTDESTCTLTSSRCGSRMSSTSSSYKHNSSRLSGYSSDFTNITDMSDFSETERFSSYLSDDNVFMEKPSTLGQDKSSLLDMSPYLDSSFTLNNFEVCFSLKKAFHEIRMWIEVRDLTYLYILLHFLYHCK